MGKFALIYLDNNATTRPSKEVVAAVIEGLETVWANPSSPHGPGQLAARSIAAARDRLAEMLDVMPERIVFTSGATEANEAVLRRSLKNRRSLVTSDAEHPAVSGLYRREAPELIRIVPIDAAGRWDMDALQRHLADAPALVALAWANGETGVLQDLPQICDLARTRNAPVLVDASQAVGRMRIAAHDLGADYLTLSGHKLHAPKGIGALVCLDDDADNLTIQVGGEQENGRRGGTENVPGIIGMGVAFELRRKDLDRAANHLAALRNRFEAALFDLIPNLRINGADAPRVPNTSNIKFSGIDGMALVARLEERGIVCSQVSACSSGTPEPSKTLTAMGCSAEDAFASVRFGFAVDNILSEVEATVQIMAEEVSFLRKTMGGLS